MAQYQRGGGRFKKLGRFATESVDMAAIDYKNLDLLKSCVAPDSGKIMPSRTTGTSAKIQRAVAREIKRARILALLPFDHSHRDR